MLQNKLAYYHLPGLFEFYKLYSLFLPLFRKHREYFYDWCAIGSIYGAPADCLWGGGRVGLGIAEPKEALALVEEYGISARLTFSNSLLQPEHLSDKLCNELCRLFSKSARNGVIVHSELLLRYLQENYPGFYYVSSTTKVLTELQELVAELNRLEFSYIVPDFRFNNCFATLERLPSKEKVELLCNECCWTGCQERRACYENVSRKNLGEPYADFICRSPGGEEGYRFSRAMASPSFISVEAIQKEYLPRGLTNFKLEGRGLGSALVLEFLLYYLTKPQYQLQVREAIYLDSMLDLF